MAHFAFSELNIWAILVAGVMNMVIGASWYSEALFGKKWMAYLGFKKEELNPSAALFGFVFILGLLVAVVMALFLQGASALEGLLYGALIGLGLVIPTLITHALYEQRKAGLILLTSGHVLVNFMAFGALLAGWQ
jgi:hypothetical protein